MTEHTSTGPESSSTQPALALGAILVIVGLILLAGQLVDFGFGTLGWPLWIVGIGVAILLAGFFFVPEQPVVVAGTIGTTLGLVLLVQEATGLWQTWAYAWALVGPAAGGLGMLLWGLRRGDAGPARAGLWGLLGGLALFGLGVLFFEGIIGLSGFDLAIPEWALPAAIIAVGAVVLVRGLLQRGEPEGS
jgi:hypothetical protein